MKNNEFSFLNIKPQYKSENEYLKALKSEIDLMLKLSGKSEKQVYEYDLPGVLVPIHGDITSFNMIISPANGYPIFIIKRNF